MYLKRSHLERTEEQPPLTEFPEPRSTNDIDVFLRAEVLADADRTTEFATTITRLGYEPVEQAKYLQWKRAVRLGEFTGEVKIDVLVGPYQPFKSRLKVKPPRVRPKLLNVQFHAHEVPEAVAVDEQPLELPVSGIRTNGTRYAGVVCVPEAFPYLMMKLIAFDDRKDDADKDQGRHHAFDLYNIVAMMTNKSTTERSNSGRNIPTIRWSAEPVIL